MAKGKAKNDTENDANNDCNSNACVLRVPLHVQRLLRLLKWTMQCYRGFSWVIEANLRG